tara:strand:+ start:22724 stop:23704 length:981 start_codon:yes stop_codon:yes gene_type:complete
MFSHLKRIISRFRNPLLKNKRLGTYAFFLIMSFAFWCLTMMSKIHETTLLVPISYINYPEDLVEIEEPLEYVKVRVKTTGVSIILFHLLNNNSLVLNYMVSNSQPIDDGKNLFWIMNSKRNELVNALGSSMEIMDITPERVVVPFTQRTKKEVPIVLNAEIHYKQGYWLVNDIDIIPSSVVLYGDQSLLDTVNSVETTLLNLKAIDENHICNIPLVLPEAVKCKSRSVSVEVCVEPFIEEVVIQEVEVRNLPRGYSMNLFPKQVNVTLRFPKDKYQLLQGNLFRLYIDASNFVEHKTLEVQYDNLSANVKIVRISPNFLEFFLIKE